MKIRKINKSVNEIITGAEYLGQGASKEGYLKGDTVYKIPRGRYIIEDENLELAFPDTMEEVDQFLYDVYDLSRYMVWPLGQFAIELIVWEAIQQLRKEGLEINCLAEIKDYYYDKNGVIVIEQEATDVDYNYNDEAVKEAIDNMRSEIDTLIPILEERFNIKLRDIRSGNYGIAADGTAKLFDFGISTTTQLDSYGSYSCPNSWEDEYEEEYNSYEGE
jgi:hypothetical protein